MTHNPVGLGRYDSKEQLRRECTPELYREVRALWKAHSLAEDRRDIPALLATLTEDCVYEVVPAGVTWRGHEGAARFYAELLRAFPDVDFALQNIVIGPQGVCEEALLTGTYSAEWLGIPAAGRKVAFPVVIFFPWHPERKKFSGERVFVDLGGLREGRY